MYLPSNEATANVVHRDIDIHFQGQESYIHNIIRYSLLKILDLENVGQYHDVQHSQWLHSTANT